MELFSGKSDGIFYNNSGLLKIVAHKEVKIKFDGPRSERRRPGGSMRAGYRAVVAAKDTTLLDYIGITLEIKHSIALKLFLPYLLVFIKI